MSVCPQFERGANDVGAAARGHDLIVVAMNVGHIIAGLFKAAAAAVALLEIADERSVLERKREHGLEWKFNWAREIFAQMVVDLVSRLVCLPRRATRSGSRRSSRDPDTATNAVLQGRFSRD